MKKFLFYCILFIYSCYSGSKEIEIKTKTKEIKTDSIDTPLTIIYFKDILSKFPIIEPRSLYIDTDTLPENMINLSNKEIEKLNLNSIIEKEAIPYSNWSIIGKYDSKEYISLFFFYTMEGESVYKINFSKKDSTIVGNIELSYFYNPCEEVSYSSTKKNKNIYSKTTINEYETWTEDSKGTKFIETKTQKWIESEFGKIDSLPSKTNVDSKKIKSN